MSSKALLDQTILLPRPREITAGPGMCHASTPPLIEIDPSLPPQGYSIGIQPGTLRIAHADAGGLFYAQATIAQLVRIHGESLPCGTIRDWPGFPSRGVMLDISRDRVPGMDTLRMLVDEFASWKINRLELYTEHTFAYRNHPEVWRGASPMTPEEIRELDALCRMRHIDLVPNQNTFGHMARWLKHPRYTPLAEAPDGYEAWGRRYTGPYGLNPLDPRSLELVADLFADLLPNFTSREFNVGCDETVDLGQGRSREACERLGKGRVYLDYLVKMQSLAEQHGRRMNFWGDIILHYPELIPELPPDVVALVWGYEADHPFDRECAAFAASKIPFHVCPGTSTWNSLVGRTTNALRNIRSAAESGLRHGASGLMVTDWGDNGHWQPLPFSYPGVAAAAAWSWCADSNPEDLLPQQLDTHVYRDAAGESARATLALGDAHTSLPAPRANSSHLFWLLRDEDPAALAATLPAESLEDALHRIREASAGLTRLRLQRPDGAQISREILLGAWMADYACRRGIALRTGASTRHLLSELPRLAASMRATWLDRHRPGGLDDSLAPLTRRIPSTF